MKVHQLVDPQEFREDEWLKIRTRRVDAFCIFTPKNWDSDLRLFSGQKKNFWVAFQLTLVRAQFSFLRGELLNFGGVLSWELTYPLPKDFCLRLPKPLGLEVFDLLRCLEDDFPPR